MYLYNDTGEDKVKIVKTGRKYLYVQLVSDSYPEGYGAHIRLEPFDGKGAYRTTDNYKVYYYTKAMLEYRNLNYRYKNILSKLYSNGSTWCIPDVYEKTIEHLDELKVLAEKILHFKF